MTKDEQTLVVITTGGKQYLVHEGAKIRVEKLEIEPAEGITFEQVLMTSKGNTVTIGAPYIEGAKVKGTIVRHGRQPKVFGAKVKAKKRYKRYFGHKQHFTEVAIEKISA